MPNPIRLGIVGATVTEGGSGWGANAHVPALNVLPDFELAAVCTAHEDTAAASREKFGARLAFHDMNDMVASDEVDLVAVSVRVPLHHQLVMASLEANKPTFCEWPLGASLAEAEEMANLARDRGLSTAVGLQARSDPAVRYARDLVARGHIGEVLNASLSVKRELPTERGPGRSWQAVRANGANPLTIQGGHAIDAMCFILGEITEVSARVATRIPQWRDADTGDAIPVDAPDTIAAIGHTDDGIEMSIHVAGVPAGGSGSRLEIYGREGALFLTAMSLNIGPVVLHGVQGAGDLTELRPPDEYLIAPEGTPPGPPRNVAFGYTRLADAIAGGTPFDPDFDVAVQRHRLLEAIERASDTGTVVRVGT